MSHYHYPPERLPLPVLYVMRVLLIEQYQKFAEPETKERIEEISKVIEAKEKEQEAKHG